MYSYKTMTKFYILIGIIFLGIIIIGLSVWINQNKTSHTQSTTILLPITVRGDEVDPGPIENECQRRMGEYIQSSEFKHKEFSHCNLMESKVGFNQQECPNGFSPQGCSICTLKCE